MTRGVPKGTCTQCHKEWFGWGLINVPTPCDCGGKITITNREEIWIKNAASENGTRKECGNDPNRRGSQ